MSKNTSLNVTIPPLHLPFLDPTGRLSTYWHSVMLTLYNRTGGVTGVSSANSLSTASAAQDAAIAAQIIATTGVTSAGTAQTSATIGITNAATAQATADAAAAGLNNLAATVVYRASFQTVGIAPLANPVFSGSFTTALLPKASSDAAAAALGVQVGQYYVNGSLVSQRQS